MAEVTYAEPTTRTPLHFDVLPPIEQSSPITTTTPTKQPFTANQDVPGQLTRPNNYHAQPHTMPSVQEQIKNDGATWKTIDVTPKTTATPAPRTNNTSASVLAGTNVVSGNNFAQEQAAEAAAYYGGWALSGFWDGAIEGKNYPNEQLRLKRDAAEDSAYTIGQKTGNEIREIALDAKHTIKDLWENRPHFEIPKIQVPKFSFPQLPKIDIPKIPEFNPQPKPQDKPIIGQPKPTVPEPEQKPQPEPKEKDIPRLKEPAPKPIPKDLTKQLRDLELSPCGSISFGYVTATKVLESRYVLNSSGGYHLERITVSATIEEVYNTWVKYNVGSEAPTIIEFIEAGGGTGQVNTFKINQVTSYDAYYGIGGFINSNQPTRSYPFNDIYYPYYSYGSANISVNGVNNNLAINAVLDHLSGGYPGEVYKINVSQIDAKNCPLKPVLPDPPPPPPKDCNCMAQCCPDIDYRKIQAMIEEAVKKLDVTPAIPESWLIRPEHHRPQLIFQFGEMIAKDKIGSAKYPLTIPHPKPNKPKKTSIPTYKKGNWEMIYVLKDNSKITIHALNEVEGMRVLNAAKALVLPDYLNGAYLSKSSKVITKTPLAEIFVTPKIAKYFPDGRKSTKPEWIVKF